MKIYAVGDSLLVQAFELIGVPGHVAERQEDIAGTLAALANKCELILLQSSYAQPIRGEQLDDLARKSNCLVLEVPGIGDSAPGGAPLLKSIQSSLGATKR